MIARGSALVAVLSTVSAEKLCHLGYNMGDNDLERAIVGDVEEYAKSPAASTINTIKHIQHTINIHSFEVTRI